MDRPDVVFALGFVTWRSAAAGHRQWAVHRLHDAVLSSPAIGRVLVADPPRSVAVVARRIGRPSPVPAQERIALTSPLRARRRDPTDPAAIARAYRSWDRWVERAARRHGVNRPAILTHSPFVAAFAPLRWAGPVTYFVTDDLASHPAYAPYRQALLAAYGALRERGAAIAAVSEPIVERIAPTGPAIVVPNGVDPAEWAEPGPPPAWLAQLPRPLAIYAGTLDTRLDVGAVRAAADAVASVLLVGGGRDEAHVAPLAALGNVHLHGDVPRAELAAAIAAADVGLVPHVRTPLTEAMSPLKLYEYLAAGLPVAAADLAPMRGVSERAVLAGDAFGEAVRAALALGRASDTERRAFADEHAWARGHARILDLTLRRPA